MRRILISPLLHFFALGELIFAIFAVLDDTPPAPPDTITLSVAGARQLADQFSEKWSRPPSENELTSMMQAWAKDEAMVREALALGLDRGDEMIRQRLNVKMRFLAESRAATLVPTDADLQAYLVKHRNKFEIPAMIAFVQIVLPDDEAEQSVIRQAVKTGTDPATLGVPSLLPASVPLTRLAAIDRIFGGDFGAALGAQADGIWSGPIDSAFGSHLVRVTNRTKAVLPPLNDIRDRVETGWRADQAHNLREAFMRDTIARFDVSLPAVAEVLSP
ncbi:MAG: peptidyl-prolyl cis-trans isomerase [Paracoccus sp. (in: a-proteobacteria)]